MMNDAVCVPHSPDADFTITSTWPAVWVKISSSWVCLLLYTWTLMAPMILTNRDFSWIWICLTVGPPRSAQEESVSPSWPTGSFHNLQRTNQITPRNHSNMKAELSSASEMCFCIYLCGLNKMFYIGIHFNQICRVHDCPVSFQKMAPQATKTTDIRR